VTSAPTPLDLAVDALAVHRITRLLQKDSLFTRPREKFVAATYSDEPHSLHLLAECPHCLSVHAAFFITLTHTRPLRFLRPVIYALAIADATSLYAEYVERRAENTNNSNNNTVSTWG